MTRLPRASGKEIIRVLRRLDYTLVRVEGSHHYLKKLGSGEGVCVPVHGNRALELHTLRSILRACGLSADDLVRLLRE